MVELIQITEGFFACGVAASVYGVADPAGVMMPEPVFANIGKLLLGIPARTLADRRNKRKSGKAAAKRKQACF